MSRPTITTILKLDAKDFIGTPHEIVMKAKLDACWEQKKEVIDEMDGIVGDPLANYEQVQALQAQFKYLEEAHDVLSDEYEEMGLIYKREDV